MRKLAILGLVSMFLFYKTGVVFAENSAIFGIVTTIPPSAQAGKEIFFQVRITNTGTESWVSGEYSVFIKIYDGNKNYLTETDKIRQFKDTDPGEMLTANIDFDIPVEYSGTYHYRVGIEFEEMALYSHYFILKILPFIAVPKVKRWTGNVKIGYQDDQVIESTGSLNLRLVNLLPRGSYLKFSTSGQDTPTTEPKLSNFLVFYHSKKLDISGGDSSAGLSQLTLSRWRGVKVENRLGRINLVGLAGSTQKAFEDDLYGLRGSINLTDNFEVAANYVERKKGENSVTSLQGELIISPEMTLSGEYGWSSYGGEEAAQESKRGNAFWIAASAYSEKLTLDGSYQRTGDNFFSIADATLLNGQEEYDVSLDYSLTDYINGTLYYNRYYENLSRQGGISRYSEADASLSFSLPKLPSLTIGYDVSKDFSSDSSEVLTNDTTDTVTLGISYPIKKVRLFMSHSRSDYRDRTEFPSRETTMSNTYGISAPWGRHLVFSANYGTFESRDLARTERRSRQQVTLKSKYIIIPRKLVASISHTIGRNKNSQGRLESKKGTTNIGLSYYLTKRSVVRLGYAIARNVDFISNSISSSDSRNAHITYSHIFVERHNLEIEYGLTGSGTLDNSSRSYQNVRITYGYEF